MSGYTIQRLPGVTTNIPLSTAILQDMVLASINLDQMATTLENNQPIETIQDIPSRLEHVIAIYNDNIGQINWIVGNLKKEFMSLPHIRAGIYIRHNINGESDELNEIIQLANIGILHESLKLKIEKVTQRSMVYNLPVQNLPQLTTLLLKVREYVIRVPTLRQRHEGANNGSSSPWGTPSSSRFTTTTTTTNTTPTLLTPVAVNVDTLATALESRLTFEAVAPPQPAPASKFASASLFTDILPTGQSYGICHGPSWVANPVSFVHEDRDKGWYGQIPIGVEFKFVIIGQDGSIVRYENHQPTRRIEEGTSSVSFHTNDVKFS